jgi:hypothetical protein
VPDQNKLKAFAEQGVSITPTCQTCVYSDFGANSKGWGACMAGSYTHLKTGKTAALPVHQCMVCPLYDKVPDARPHGYGGNAMSTLGEYANLLEWLEPPEEK